MTAALAAATLPRPLDPGEAFFFLQDHISCMNFVVFAERTGHLEPGRIQAALDLIQQENQLLQASISWTDTTGLRFEPAPGQPVTLQIRRCGAQDWQGWIEHELSQPFATGTAPLMRCLYLELVAPARSVLGLSFHHAIADGRSGSAMLARLLRLLAAPAATSQAARPAALPAMVDAFPPQFRWTEQPEAAKQLKATLIDDYRRHGAVPPIPWLAAEASERRPRWLRQRLDAELTQALITQARARGSSVHGLLCAAQLLAQCQLQPDAPSTVFLLSCPVDLRQHLQPAQPTAPTGFFTSLISNTFRVGADTDIWDLARDVISQTRRQIARGEGHLLYHMFGLNGAPVLPEHMAAFRKKSLASLPNTMVSNLGVVDTVSEDPAVEAISFALCPMPYQTLFTAASTYQNQLILNIGFDAARLPEASASLLAEAMATHLRLAARAQST
ncbi:MAG: hypothetical protein KBF66_02340 [Rhodoferax sp.]|uniref:phthiocerol/phthiodiolone dimycocerosyl transferase family protein n=1 Tax=Rhodoferax sp. TaxID=50421 RepID=UPI001B5F7DA2|nr:hypothetical protein [Rhodoferax sp.]MBP8224631.1 hypothetical protein [Acidovorax sp.]MBP9904369.1 hypothetical protein [Rhodoferax sp.]